MKVSEVLEDLDKLREHDGTITELVNISGFDEYADYDFFYIEFEGYIPKDEKNERPGITFCRLIGTLTESERNEIND